MQRKLAGALLVALALGAVACGSASKPLTAAQLRMKANVVCRDMSRRVQALAKASTQATLRASFGRAADVMDDDLGRLRALVPPKQLAGRYASFIAWEGSRRDAARALSQGKRLNARMRLAVHDHLSPVIPLSRQLGIPSCR